MSDDGSVKFFGHLIGFLAIAAGTLGLVWLIVFLVKSIGGML